MPLRVSLSRMLMKLELLSLWWMHALRTTEWTLCHLAPSKGHSAIESMGVLLVFVGVLIHDHYKVYFRYAAHHVLCNAHHLRELQGVVDRDCNHLAGRRQRLLRPAWHLVKGYRKIGMQAMPEIIRQRIDSLFEQQERHKLKKLHIWSECVSGEAVTRSKYESFQPVQATG